MDYSIQLRHEVTKALNRLNFRLPAPKLMRLSSKDGKLEDLSLLLHQFFTSDFSMLMKRS